MKGLAFMWSQREETTDNSITVYCHSNKLNKDADSRAICLITSDYHISYMNSDHAMHFKLYTTI